MGENVAEHASLLSVNQVVRLSSRSEDFFAVVVHTKRRQAIGEVHDAGRRLMPSREHRSGLQDGYWSIRTCFTVI